MASSVDLPQPDGPEMDTYSPRFIFNSISERACVSTSSVKNTFVTFSRRITGCSTVLITISSIASIQTHMIEVIPRRHIRNDYLVSGLETVEHFNTIHRTSADFTCRRDA